MKCPFCQYERVEHDAQVPSWKCPSCEKVYSKYKPPQKKEGRTSSVDIFKDGYVRIFIGIVFVVWGFYDLFQNETTGLGTTAVVGRRINFESSPIEFTICISITFGIGFYLVYLGRKALRKTK